MSEPRPFYDFKVEGPVQAEVFVVYLHGRAIRLSGPCGAEPWIIELGEDDDPLETVARLVRSNLGEPVVVHSTSWRRTGGAVVLSFVVVVEPALVAGLQWREVGRAELARNQATKAAAAVASDQVLEHGLRHLAWLARDDPVVRAELSGDWTSVLEPYVPEPFRHLR